jgi:hypothetical protein
MIRILVVLCCLGVSAVYAEETQKPSMEFLEFIGEWEDKDGQWQDPMQFKDMDDAELQKAQTGTRPVSNTKVSDEKDEVKGHEK